MLALNLVRQAFWVRRVPCHLTGVASRVGGDPPKNADSIRQHERNTVPVPSPLGHVNNNQKTISVDPIYTCISDIRVTVSSLFHGHTRETQEYRMIYIVVIDFRIGGKQASESDTVVHHAKGNSHEFITRAKA